MPGIASGANRVDTRKLPKTTGIKFSGVDANWGKEAVGFAIGGIPPAGHRQPQQTFLDPDLKTFDSLWAAAGTPFALFKLSQKDLEELTGGIWVELTDMR